MSVTDLLKLTGLFTSGQNFLRHSNSIDPDIWSGRYLSAGAEVVSSGELSPNGRMETCALMTTNISSSTDVFEYVALEPGKYYTISAWARAVSDVRSVAGWVVLFPQSGYVTDISCLDDVQVCKLGRGWKRYFHTIYTNSIASVTSMQASINWSVESPYPVAYWGWSITETSTLAPFVVTSTDPSTPFFDGLVELRPTYKSKYNSKALGSSVRTLGGRLFRVSEGYRESVKLEFESVTSLQSNLIESHWDAGTPLYFYDGVRPESYLRKITNKSNPIQKYDDTVSDTMRCILDLERYY